MVDYLGYMGCWIVLGVLLTMFIESGSQIGLSCALFTLILALKNNNEDFFSHKIHAIIIVHYTHL